MGSKKKVSVIVTEKGAKKTASSLQKVDRGIAGISRSALNTTLAMGGMFLGFQTLKKGIDATIGASVRQEAIFRKLQTSIEITGTKYKDVSKDVDLMFRSIQDLTAFGDTETAEVFTTLIQLTGDYDTAVKALPVTLDLAASGLFDSATAARMMGQVMNGELTTLGRYFAEFKQGNPEMANLKTAAEKAAFGLKILNEKVGGTAAKNINTVSGQWKQLKNELEDIGESLGDTALPKILELLKEFNEMLFGADKRARQLGEAYDFMNEHAGEFTDSQLNALRAGQDMIDNYDDQKGAIEAFLLVFNIARGDIDTMSSESLPALVEATKDVEEAIDDLGENVVTDFKGMEDAAEDFSRTLSRSIVDSIKEDLKWFKTFEEAFKDMLIGMAAELAASKVINFFKNNVSFDSVEESGGGRVSGAASGAALGSAIAPGVGTVIGGALGFLFAHEGGMVTNQGIQKFHRGGMVGGEVPAILQVGEAVLSRDAVRRLNEGRGGYTFVIENINIYGGNAQGMEDMIRSNAFGDAFLGAIQDGVVRVN